MRPRQRVAVRFRNARPFRLPFLNFLSALWLTAALNIPFWRAVWDAAGGVHAPSRMFLLTLPVAVLITIWLTLEALTWGRAAKPLLFVLLVASAAAAYFTTHYGVVFDRTMIANIAETHWRETAELLSPQLATWIVGLGVLPAVIVARIPLRRESWRTQLLVKGTTCVALVITGIVVAAPLMSSYASFFRTHRELRLVLVPSNLIAGAHGYLSAKLRTPAKLERVGLDARRAVAGVKPTLLLVIVGETARAANFGLDGYRRETTSVLSQNQDVFNFRQVSSCGTSTAVSVPCMFQDVGRAGYSDALATSRENLLDVVQRAGFTVLWRDNNSGCKHVCDRVGFEDVSEAHVPGLCGNGSCYDEILLHGLQDRIDALDRDAVVVLHLLGSHGPAYYLRYPPAFRRFSPTCDTPELDRCDRSMIVNAYDNTIAYTDYVLGKAISLLERNSTKFDTALVYVSDHGESLGEHGLYLHGLPYALAPSEQTHVPFLFWLPARTREHLGIDESCLRARADARLSHDQLYHSTLGLLRIKTSVYKGEKDLFNGCDKAKEHRT